MSKLIGNVVKVSRGTSRLLPLQVVTRSIKTKEESQPNHDVPNLRTFDTVWAREHGSRPYHLRRPLRIKGHGKTVVLNPFYNKGSAFLPGERDRLGIRGIIPSRELKMSDQIQRVLDQLNKEETNIAKYRCLRDVHDRNETLFHRICVDYIETVAPLIYTPTVGEACDKFGHDYRRARGMYFCHEDHGHMAGMVYNWPAHDVHVIVVTDGSRILGLGDLGANGMGIPIGKLALYCAAGGIAPHRVLPIMFDVGTNNKKLLDDRMYMGMQHHRLEGNAYYELLDELMYALTTRWPNVLIQFEDFSSDKAMTILNRYRNHYVCFNDDIQGTGAVAVAGLLSALQQLGLSNEDICNQRIVIAGAGSAGLGVANALLEAMVKAGLPREQALKNFWITDVNGVVHAGSPSATEASLKFARTDTAGMPLLDCIKAVKPTALLGLTGQGGLFTEEILKSMGNGTQNPIIFPLSNPTDNAECTAQECIEATEGRAVFASGSPFSPLVYEGRQISPSQCNNMFIFPGLGLGATLGNCQTVSDGMIHQCSLTLASSLTDEEREKGQIFPSVGRIRNVSLQIAAGVIRQAAREGLIPEARLDQLPNLVAEDVLESYIRRKMYDPVYVPLINPPKRHH
eukprot:m.22376 g.22376  ORF g.22376 m.22376 type:complete len:626 (-) comp13801_c0_seq1:137-2014(-)